MCYGNRRSLFAAQKIEDDACMKSLLGTMIGHSLLKAVPNANTFQTVLRVVKAWAKRRCIYGKVYGYLGGLAWAVLTARVCQLYPSALPAMVLRNFFKVCRPDRAVAWPCTQGAVVCVQTVAALLRRTENQNVQTGPSGDVRSATITGAMSRGAHPSHPVCFRGQPLFPCEPTTGERTACMGCALPALYVGDSPRHGLKALYQFLSNSKHPPVLSAMKGHRGHAV